jgi:hypothetical protein
MRVATQRQPQQALRQYRRNVIGFDGFDGRPECFRGDAAWRAWRQMTMTGFALRASIGAALAVALTMAAAPGGRAMDGLKTFETTYAVTYSGIDLGRFVAKGRFDGASYSLEGSGQFRVLEGLLFNWTGATASSGAIDAGGPRPASFIFNQKTGGKSERLRVRYRGQAVTEVDISPEWRPEPGIVPVRKSQLTGSLDPMSAIFLLGRASPGASGAALCQRRIPVFDGRQRFDLVLSHRKTVQVKNEGAARYTGPVVVCQVKYVPISGHFRDHAGTTHLAKSPDIEVWLVPLPRASHYVPYAIHLPTLGGGFASATAISFRASSDPRRAAMDATMEPR